LTLNQKPTAQTMNLKLFQKPIVAASLLSLPQSVFACITCDRQIREGIFNSAFGRNALLMVLPFAVLGGLVAWLAWLSGRRYKTRSTAGTGAKTPVPLLSAALILGIGAGGFIDGIVLHQILQWHEMISAKLPPTTYVAKSINMFWDGVFHAVTLVVTIVGIVRLWKLLHRSDIDRSGNLLAGGMLAGWALFNIVEGLFDHHLLKLHNVRERTPEPAAWNYGFLLFSVALLLAGFFIAQARKPINLKTGKGA
jgi:uncharacterized membrane protein